MPTYEYRCPSCGHVFDVFQKMSDEPGAECPECGAAAERQFSAGAGFLFKGDGFYITDYRSDSYRKAAEKDRAQTGGEAKSDSGGTSDSSGSTSDASGATSSSGTASSDA